MALKVNAAGIALIKSFEQCRLTAYLDKNDGWTIGWGHLSGGGSGALKVTAGMRITQDLADKIFADDIQFFAKGVEALLTSPPDENEFAALVSLAFNIGLHNFRYSTALKWFNAGVLPASVAKAIEYWNKDDGTVVAGLVRRRAAEAKLYLTPSPAAASVAVQESNTNSTGDTTMKASIFWALVRHALTAVSGAGILDGIITGDEITTGASAVGVLIGIATSVFGKVKAAREKSGNK